MIKYITLGIVAILIFVTGFFLKGNGVHHSNSVLHFLPIFMKVASLLISLYIIKRVFGLFRHSSKTIEDGILTIGTIRSIRRTGVSINDQPQLEIELEFVTEDGEEIIASEKSVVQQIDLVDVQPGNILPLIYDPVDPENISLDVDSSQEEVQEAFNQDRVRKGLMTQESMDIIKSGVKGVGIVTTLTPTGDYAGDAIELKIGLLITRPDESRFESTVTKLIEERYLKHIQVGSKVDAYYLPYDEDEIFISFRVG